LFFCSLITTHSSYTDCIKLKKNIDHIAAATFMAVFAPPDLSGGGGDGGIKRGMSGTGKGGGGGGEGGGGGGGRVEAPWGSAGGGGRGAGGELEAAWGSGGAGGGARYIESNTRNEVCVCVKERERVCV
jgi:hypothetical protein